MGNFVNAGASLQASSVANLTSDELRTEFPGLARRGD